MVDSELTVAEVAASRARARAEVGVDDPPPEEAAAAIAAHLLAPKAQPEAPCSSPTG